MHVFDVLLLSAMVAVPIKQKVYFYVILTLVYTYMTYFRAKSILKHEHSVRRCGMILCIIIRYLCDFSQGTKLIAR